VASLSPTLKEKAERCDTNL